MADALACGVPVDQVLAQVAEHLPPADPAHQANCPSCRAALAELEDLWAPVRALAAEKVRSPTGLLDAVMERVRALPRQTWYAVLPTPQGDTRIAARVVGAVARLAAEEVPQISLALGGGRVGADHGLSDIAGNAGEAATDIGVAGTHVVVDVHVVVQMGAHIPGLASQVRRHITERVSQHTGLTTAEVNIAVVDVLPTTKEPLTARAAQATPPSTDAAGSSSGGAAGNRSAFPPPSASLTVQRPAVPARSATRWAPSATHEPTTRRQRTRRQRTTKVEKSITVKVPVSTAYNQWTQFEDFPQFMGGVTSVNQHGDGRLSWVANIGGVERQWEARVLEQVTDRKIAWAATQGATNAGQVSFEPASKDGTTRVTLVLEYEAQGLVEKVGAKLGFVNNQAKADLKKFKAFIEDKGYATDAWRGTINPGADVSPPGVEQAAASRGDTGKAGVSKTTTAGIALSAAAAGAAIALAAKKRTTARPTTPQPTAAQPSAPVTPVETTIPAPAPVLTPHESDPTGIPAAGSAPAGIEEPTAGLYQESTPHVFSEEDTENRTPDAPTLDGHDHDHDSDGSGDSPTRP